MALFSRILDNAWGGGRLPCFFFFQVKVSLTIQLASLHIITCVHVRLNVCGSKQLYSYTHTHTMDTPFYTNKDTQCAAMASCNTEIITRQPTTYVLYREREREREMVLASKTTNTRSETERKLISMCLHNKMNVGGNSIQPPSSVNPMYHGNTCMHTDFILTFTLYNVSVTSTCTKSTQK